MSNYNTANNTQTSPPELQGLACKPVPRMIDPPDPESLHAFILTRRTIRMYLEEPVSPGLVDRLLRLAVQAPSAHNRQPWRWVVVQTAEGRQRLAKEMAKDFRRDLLVDGVPAERVEMMVARSRQRIGEAPVVVVPCLTMSEMDRYPDPHRQRCEWQMAVQSVALACQNLMLGAHAVGLGSCWICAPIFCVPTVQRALDLPEDWEPQGLITLGWPADEGRLRERAPVESITIYR